MVLPSAWRPAVELAAHRGGHWQLEVWCRGEHVISAGAGGSADVLFWLWSASKPFIALLVWQLAERGELDIDDPVARWWLEFGRRGKQDVMIRDVLQHRSGLPAGPGGRFADAAFMADWRRSNHRLAAAPLQTPPGERAAYHYLSYGFILGEVVRRASGRELPELMSERIFAPLQMTDTHLGVPVDRARDAVPMRMPGAIGALTTAVLNATRTRAAVIPAGGVSSTAADLARFYRAMLAGGELDGARVAEPGTIAQMCVPTSDDGRPDGLLHYPLRWAQGFQLGGPALGWPAVEPFGRTSSPRTFGHNGSNVCTGYADPGNGLVVGYVSDQLTTWVADKNFMRDLGDALHAGAG